MRKLALVLVIVLLTLAIAATGQEFDEQGFLIIKAEPELPLALVTLTRSRPQYTSMVITKEVTHVPLAFSRTALTPPEKELQPKIMRDLDALLAKERI